MGGHAFPDDLQLAKLWVLAINREHKDKKGELWKPGPAARICSRHFSDDDYMNTNRFGKKPKKNNCALTLYLIYIYTRPVQLGRQEQNRQVNGHYDISYD
jgi:hypothetical protein